jgi:predicted helicase
MKPEFTTFFPLGIKEAENNIRGASVKTLTKSFLVGINSSRDSVVYNFNLEMLTHEVKKFTEDYNAEVFRWVAGSRPKDVDNFVHYDKVKWSEHLKNELKREKFAQADNARFRIAIYRPFCKKWLYYDTTFIDRPSSFNEVFPNYAAMQENRIICLTLFGSEKPFMVLVTNTISDYHLVGAGCGTQCFPFYTYDDNGSNRRENITDWALSQFQTQYGSEVTKWDIFYYVYAMLHHPQYRERYAENLKRELPHIPLLHRKEAFLACVSIGKQLMDINLSYEQAKEYPLEWIENKDVPFSWRVEKMHLTPDKMAVVVNESLTLSGIPQECFQYRLGNRSALDWVIDQYQVSVDKRSGIVSDPNNLDDEDYIVRLVGKVIMVSVETVRLVKELAQAVKMEDWLSEAVEENI